MSKDDIVRSVPFFRREACQRERLKIETLHIKNIRVKSDTNRIDKYLSQLLSSHYIFYTLPSDVIFANTQIVIIENRIIADYNQAGTVLQTLIGLIKLIFKISLGMTRY